MVLFCETSLKIGTGGGVAVVPCSDGRLALTLVSTIFKLVGGPKNIGLSFSDPIGHIGFPWRPFWIYEASLNLLEWYHIEAIWIHWIVYANHSRPNLGRSTQSNKKKPIHCLWHHWLLAYLSPSLITWIFWQHGVDIFLSLCFLLSSLEYSDIMGLTYSLTYVHIQLPTA